MQKGIATSHLGTRIVPEHQLQSLSKRNRLYAGVIHALLHGARVQGLSRRRERLSLDRNLHTLTHFSCPTANVALSNTPTHFPFPATNVAHLSSSTPVSFPITKLAISCTSAHFANVWGFWMSQRGPKGTTFCASTSCFLMLAVMLTSILDHCKCSSTSVGFVFTLPPVIWMNSALMAIRIPIQAVQPVETGVKARFPLAFHQLLRDSSVNLNNCDQGSHPRPLWHFPDPLDDRHRLWSRQKWGFSSFFAVFLKLWYKLKSAKQGFARF